MFQSSPFPKEGRYGTPLGRGGMRHVSILALPEGRALLASGRSPLEVMMFQSSPFPKEGRY
ncbi:MAG: hypothetical protein OJF47_004075 [Nitrospira sp.]|nr:MAG: hypothetical protein OJF47_004075 [Nitrospira sp.]